MIKLAVSRIFDITDMPINIFLFSNPKALNSNSDFTDNIEITPANDSHEAKKEEYINKELD